MLVWGHWTENRPHWVRDVTYDEDRSQIRKLNVPRVMATLRNTTISILRLAGARYIAKAVRWCAGTPKIAGAWSGRLGPGNDRSQGAGVEVGEGRDC